MTTSKKTTMVPYARILREHELFVTSVSSVHVEAPHTVTEEALRAVYALMIQSGSKGYSREEFMHAKNLLGMHLTVVTDDAYITFQLQARNEVLGKALSLFKTMLVTPTWNTAELKRVKEYLTNQLILSKEDARGRAHEHFVNEFVHENDWRYSFDTDAFIKAIAGVQVKHLVNLHAKVFESTWITTSGGPSASCKKVEQMLNSLSVKSPKSPQGTPYNILVHDNTILRFEDIPHKQNIEFSIGGALPFVTTNSAYPAFVFGMSVLAIYGGFTGRLMSTVREKEGLTYMIYGRIEDMTPQEQGYWRIATFFSPKDTERGIASTLHQINLMRTKGITEDELIRFKAILTTRYTLAKDSLLRSVSDMQGRRVSGISEETHADILKKIQTLTVSEVNSVMKQYLTTEALVISGAGPISGIRANLEKKFGNTD